MYQPQDGECHGHACGRVVECDARIAVADDRVVAASAFKFVEGRARGVDPGAACIRARGSKSSSVVGVVKVGPYDRLDRP